MGAGERSQYFSVQLALAVLFAMHNNIPRNVLVPGAAMQRGTQHTTEVGQMRVW